MKKILSEFEIYHIQTWITRITGVVFLAIFIVFFAPLIALSSLNLLAIGIVVIFLFTYLLGISSIVDNSLLNSTLIIISVLIFQFILFYVGLPERIINTHVLIIPGFITLIMYLITHRSYIRIDKDLISLDQKYRITNAMLQITPDLLVNDNLDTVLQKILESAISVMPKAQKGSILIRDGNIMRFHAAVGYNLAILQEIELKLDEMLQYKLGVLNEPSIIKDIKTFDEVHIDHVKTKLLDTNQALVAKSILTCSLKLHGKIYGFINLDNIDSYDAFTEQDKVHVKHLANLIDLALNNHLLVKDIYRLSRYDELTGAATRKYNKTLLNDTIKMAEEKQQIFTICMIDMNGLKKVNDRFGHDAGDQFLIHFAKMVKKSIPKEAIFSRTGGDEFILTLPSKKAEDADEIILAIRKRLKNSPFTYENQVIPVTFGCGVSQYPRDAKKINLLIHRADQLMYLDKDKQKIDF
ncbi:MAG: diguanylate cyclase domain-containing protein [Acholeplasmataceae bacterium]